MVSGGCQAKLAGLSLSRTGLTLPFLLALALPLAWLWDQAFGEPPNALHPVAWMGHLLAPVGRWLVGQPNRTAFTGGALGWCAMAAAVGLIAQGWMNVAASLPWWLAVPMIALALKPMFAWRMLRDEVAGVERALADGLQPARNRLSRLVSRDVSAMDESLLRETAIETLAENLNDSVVAPLFWFAVFGLPGAAVYRFANTADAMWGYRGRHEWAGKWAARADDVLSWLPARLSGGLVFPLLTLHRWAALRAQACKTPSPNGGWPMGAMALHLGVRLRKPGVYVLNELAASPDARHMAQALKRAGLCAWGAMFAVTALWAWRVS